MSMMNAHPDIGTPPETHFVTTHLTPREAVSRDEWRRRLAEDRRFARLGLDPGEVLAQLEEGDGPVSMRAVYRAFLQMWKERNGAKLVGDKAPRYVEILPILHRITPGAKVLHLVRDPRSVFLSRTKAAWSAGRKSWRHLLAYAVQYEEGRTRGPQCFGERYREVFYEQLISEPDRVLTEVCHFLGVDYDPAMLRFSESASDIISEDEWAWKQEAAGPLLSQNADKWRNELSGSEIGMVESACRGPFRDGLYQRADEAPGLAGRVTARTVRTMAGVYRTVLELRLERQLHAWS
jgi:hypothetical protein